jgi:3'-phosphoadenosine 5'-phosphosulfate sulfotransferase (PAPS reductase)/FAD synthetase
MSGNPYLIQGPALISFSGGRTSAYMLKMILDAHGGTLPDDVHVCFANTGKEREETLRFVHECSSRWGVKINWLEWTPRPTESEGRKTPWGERFVEVGYNSASRQGEPFRALIERKKYLPNAVQRFCTSHLKVDTMKAFMLAHGYDRWWNAVGLRADEMRRIAKGQMRNEAGLERFTTIWPLMKAGVTSRDVWRFWLGANADPKMLSAPLPQGFDLGLYPYEGNCDDCMLKGFDILVHQERERPGTADWWIEMQAVAGSLARKPSGALWVTEYSYEEVKRAAESQPLLIPLDWRNVEFDTECGVGGTDTRIRCGRRGA